MGIINNKPCCDGRIRCFNTKHEPSPINRKGDGKLLKVVKFKKVIK